MLATAAHQLLEALRLEQAVHPSVLLEAKVAAARENYVGLAVTEIAILRAELDGRLEG